MLHELLQKFITKLRVLHVLIRTVRSVATKENDRKVLTHAFNQTSSSAPYVLIASEHTNTKSQPAGPYRQSSFSTITKVSLKMQHEPIVEKPNGYFPSLHYTTTTTTK
mmetsp:Transcript_17890/g.39035  ORF Transcript_17890/g.39035 Transcript_17890/m.39035 type:complete len:108 (+) Transcript_17890:28-351(+)